MSEVASARDSVSVTHGGIRLEFRPSSAAAGRTAAGDKPPPYKALKGGGLSPAAIDARGNRPALRQKCRRCVATAWNCGLAGQKKGRNSSQKRSIEKDEPAPAGHVQGRRPGPAAQL